MQIAANSLTALARKYSTHVEFVGVDVLDVNQMGAFDDSLLHLAAFAGQLTDLDALLSMGADIDAIGDIGNTPLHFAVLGRQPGAVEMLLAHGARSDISNEFGETPAELATILGFADVLTLFDMSGSVPRATLAEVEHMDHARQRWTEFKAIQEANFSERLQPQRPLSRRGS